MRIIDLSHPLRPGMPVYPGDPEFHSEAVHTIAVDAAQVSRVTFGSHTGTHIDAPSHTVAGGHTLDQIPLHSLIGEADHFTVIHPAAHQLITADELQPPLPARVAALVVITAGWDEFFGSEQYLRHPIIAPELAQTLLDRGMRVLAIDWLNPDRTLQNEAAPPPLIAATAASLGALPVHTLVLGTQGMIVENLRNAHSLPDRFYLTIAPLPLAGSDGAPARVFASLSTEPM